MLINNVCAVLHYPKCALQMWLEDPVERAMAVFAVSKVEDTSDDFLAFSEVSFSREMEGCRSFLGFPV